MGYCFLRGVCNFYSLFCCVGNFVNVLRKNSKLGGWGGAEDLEKLGGGENMKKLYLNLNITLNIIKYILKYHKNKSRRESLPQR